MSLKIVTPPVVEAVLLAEAKQFLRIDHDWEDVTIQRLIYTAVAIVQNRTWRAILPTVFELQMERFPNDRRIVLPYPRLTAVSEISFLSGGEWDTLSEARYEVDLVSEPGRIQVDSAGWPDTDQALTAVKVGFTAGWTRAEIPPPVWSAVVLLVTALYENRSGGMPHEADRAVDNLLGSYSVYGCEELPYLRGTDRAFSLEGI